MHYISIDQAVRAVRTCGEEVELAKCDMKSFFLFLPVHPADFDLMGFSFEENIYVDRAIAKGVFYFVFCL